MKLNKIIIFTFASLAITACRSAQTAETPASNIIKGVNYDKPLEIEMTETGIDWSKEKYTTTYYCKFEYQGDSIKRVDYIQNGDTTIYEFEWENKTKHIFITEDHERAMVLEEVYNDNMQLLTRTATRTFSLDYEDLLQTEVESLFNGYLTSTLRKTYDEKGRILEIWNNFQPHWINVSKFEYNGKIVTEYLERFMDDTVRIDPSILYKANVKEYYDDELTQLKRSYSLSHNDEIQYDETFTYHPDGRLKSHNGQPIPYDNQGRRLTDDNGNTYDYTNFTMTGFLGIKIQYLDDKFDKIVSYNIMGMQISNTYDEYRRPLTESRENGTTTNPDFDATYQYDDNITNIIRHERGFLDKEGEKTITKTAKITYEKVK